MIGRLAILALLLALPARADWPGSYAGRLAALALVETLDAELLSHDSATVTLEHWCADHHLAEPARIVAGLDRTVDRPAGVEQRKLLGVEAGEPVRYRRVRLACGSHVLSEAENWYVPARLTPEMNRLLDETDTPFGKAVADLHFRRRTLSARVLWSPLPAGWEMGAPVPAGPLVIPDHVIEHQAILGTEAGTPFSLVVERYTGEVLAFPPPATK